MIGLTMAELKVGQSAQFAKTVSEADIYLFAGITGDMNPAHVNEQYASQTFFKSRIAHGMLAAGFISTVLGCHLPGPGTVYLSQALKFLAPVRIGDTITAKAEVKELDEKKNRATLATGCWNQNGEKVLDGTAVVSPPRAVKG
jgi:3-hydroxybutyryl-CoA dehydratase